jgi:hypothetical protein
MNRTYKFWTWAGIILWLLFAYSLTCDAQERTNTQYAREFDGATVSAKVTAAQGACNPNAAIPCYIVIDADLAATTTGTMPAKCAQCYWLDYRTGGPSGGSVTYADQFGGVDACAKIAAAIADLPSTGGTVEARGIKGAQTCLNNPFVGVTKSFHLLLGNATYTTSAKWIIPHMGWVEGAGRGDAGINATVIKAAAGFPINTALVQLGNSAVSRAFHTRVEHLTIDGNNIAGSIGIYTNAANEQSGARNVLITGIRDACIRTDATSGLLMNYSFTEIECNVTTGASAAIRGVDLIGGMFANDGTFRNVTVNFGGSTKVTTAFSAQRFVGIIDHLHIENAVDGLLVVGTAAGGGVATYRNITGNSDVTNLVKISNAFPLNGQSFQSVEPYGSTNTLVDQLSGKTITAGDQVASYTIGTSNNPLMGITPTPGRGVCWKTATTLGYCSTVLDGTGACTCN